MTKSKLPMQSTTIQFASATTIASLVKLCSMILALAGGEISLDEQGVITEGILSIITLVGSIGAIYGRIKAKHSIDL